MSKTDLEKDISERLEKAGQKPQTVTCKDDLQGEVGKSTRCEVVLSNTNSFEPVVTVTKVEGTTVSYDMTPAVSKTQLEKAVAGLVSQASASPSTRSAARAAWTASWARRLIATSRSTASRRGAPSS